MQKDRVYTEERVVNNAEDTEENREMQLVLEYRSLRAFAPSGVYTIPTIQDIYKWYGLVFIRGGEYQGAIFKFCLDIPTDYPSSCPKVYFLSHVFHPLVCPDSGQLNLSPGFPCWRPRKDFIFLVLSYLKTVFHCKDYWKDIKHIQNQNASLLFENDEDQFLREVRTCVMASLDDLQDSADDFPIRLKGFNSFHKKVLDEVRNGEKVTTVPEQSEAFMNWFRKTFI